MCKFVQTYDVTPIGLSVTPMFHFGLENVTISGSGFGENVSDVLVYIGDVYCDISVLNDSCIVCYLESTAVGRTQPIVISVGNLGIYITLLYYATQIILIHTCVPRVKHIFKHSFTDSRRSTNS